MTLDEAINRCERRAECYLSGYISELDAILEPNKYRLRSGSKN